MPHLYCTYYRDNRKLETLSNIVNHVYFSISAQMWNTVKKREKNKNKCIDHGNFSKNWLQRNSRGTPRATKGQEREKENAERGIGSE